MFPEPGIPARSDRVVYNFYGAVDARGSRFGNGPDLPCTGDGRLRYTTGRIRDHEVLATVSNYVRPATFDQAAACLRCNGVVVLAGPPGSGRRAGAMALLREVTDGHLVTLSPVVTARDLAGWEFLGRRGYLLIDGDEAGLGLGSELAWADVAQRVREAGTYLVVTTTPVPGRDGASAVPYLAWERPPVAEVLRGHLAGCWAKEDVDRLVDELVARLPASYTIRWLACLARLVNAGRDPDQALADMEQLCGRQVDRWFHQPRTDQELAEVAAAGFLAGTSEPVYLAQLARLERILAIHRPASHAQPSVRRSAVPGGGLVRISHRSSRAGSTGVVAFKEHSYQRFALTRIWEISPGWFLEAVREWLDRIVCDPDRLEVASGLALLACDHPQEVQDSFLDRWSRGQLGWSGRVAATYVLWCMCREEATAPLALRIAIRWTRSADSYQRATAAVALSGELGVSYPMEAVRQLWQQLSRRDHLSESGRVALGRLFAILVDQTEEVGAVLTTLDGQRARSGRHWGARQLRKLTRQAVLAALTARSYRTGRPAVAELLRIDPGWDEVVARLWASLLRHRTTRRPGLVALWYCLRAFESMGGEPAPRAWALGRALSRAVPGSERSRLGADLARLDRERRSGRDGPPTGVVDACVAAITRAA